MSVDTKPAAANTTESSAPKRVSRPNKETYDKVLQEIQSELQAKDKELDVARANVKAALDKDNTKNPEIAGLKETLEGLKARQNALKSARNKVSSEIRAIDDRMKRKIKDLQAIKAKSPYKSTEEIDSKIAKLEKEVESGSMRLVDEKKALGDISNLKKLKKSFSGIQDLQTSIDEDRASIAELKKSSDIKEAADVSKQYEDTLAKINKIRDSQQEAFKNRNAIFDKRNALQSERETIYKKLLAHKNAYFNQLDEFRKYQKAEQAARIQREAAEKEAEAKSRRVADAQEKLEAAKEPAFAAEIAKATNLVSYFTGSSKPQEETVAAAEVKVPEGVKLIKKDEESYFVGGGSKKARKAAAAKAKENTPSSSSGKIKLTPDIIDDLISLQVGVPGSATEIEETIKKINDKIEYYKSNEEKVTKEKVEKAEAALALAKKDVEEEEKSKAESKESSN